MCMDSKVYCEPLADFVADLVQRAKDRAAAQDADFRAAVTEDIEIAVLRMEKKKNCGRIKNWLLEKYSTKGVEQKSLKKEHHFTLFNRFGFMTILFWMLHRMAIRHHKGSNLYVFNAFFWLNLSEFLVKTS